MKALLKFLCIGLCIVLFLGGCKQAPVSPSDKEKPQSSAEGIVTVDNVPAFDGTNAYIAVYNNIPNFTQNDLTSSSYESYSSLDALGRCGVAIACIGRDIMPTEDRGSIGQVKPSGWHTVKYDTVDGKYLYNRCHLIGYQLTGENANEKNLITGTRYLNIEGMLPFENMIADYIKESGNHVLYRVTPIFDGNNLVARGVQMEAKSIEDNGEGICFNVYAYNAQPSIKIDYSTGLSSLGELPQNEPQENNEVKYILNTKTKKIHLSTCSSVLNIGNENKQESSLTAEELKNNGYTACKICKP